MTHFFAVLALTLPRVVGVCHADEDIFPVWDFHEVAGMTAEVEVPLLSCDGAGGSDYNRWPTVMNSTTQVGGVSDGVSGAAAMNLSSGTLHHVQNFWAFADGYYVHLGAGLACRTESPVVTSLANRLLGALLLTYQTPRLVVGSRPHFVILCFGMGGRFAPLSALMG